MTGRVETWHHGLVARWWAEFNTGGADVPFFLGSARSAGGPVLDAGCGTGRVLLPLLRSGIDADGSDVSADMLDLLARRAESEGLAVDLYQQASHQLKLPRSYAAIIVCGAFGLGGVREDDLEALRRFRRHLSAGGRLFLDHELPYANASTWRYWLPEARLQLPQEWPATGDRRTATDGDDLEIKARIVAFDPLEQVVRREIEVTLFRDGREVAAERHALAERLYFNGEVLSLLELAGFVDVEVLHAHTSEPARSTSDHVVYVATAP